MLKEVALPFWQGGWKAKRGNLKWSLDCKGRGQLLAGPTFTGVFPGCHSHTLARVGTYPDSESRASAACSILHDNARLSVTLRIVTNGNHSVFDLRLSSQGHCRKHLITSSALPGCFWSKSDMKSAHSDVSPSIPVPSITERKKDNSDALLELSEAQGLVILNLTQPCIRCDKRVPSVCGSW